MEETTIASAVVLPEQTETPPRSPTLKRRQSSLDSSEAKRPRFSTEQSQDFKSAPPSSADGQDRRRSSARGRGVVEERKRGQRLFGAILGTLSQSSSSVGQRKRAEIEKKQLDKLKARREEDEERKQKRKEELTVTRRRQQKLWDEEGIRMRHRNTLAMAHFLKTKAEPPLCYKPWELRAEEEEIIQSQISATQEEVNREIAEFEERSRQEEQEEPENTKDEPHRPQEIKQPKPESLPDRKMDDAKAKREELPTEDNNVTQDTTDQNGAKSETNNTGSRETEEHTAADEGGEELVEGQEDDVIY
ncbi:putative pinin sdk mema domain-containing protein [Phaeomoniella chlamydospora]|uniref:Putative pinin sdk mema domain-containing protein n=1 Tax=Phaeomoniella chlamydospora TaxID=158046 RepID=A0A0G2H485_PHACM|nr:putative pinin sdk mema domain-containing protein [Phaeomoniella chlamydospora]